MSGTPIPGGLLLRCGCVASSLGDEFSYRCARDADLRGAYSLSEITSGGSDRAGLASIMPRIARALGAFV